MYGVLELILVAIVVLTPISFRLIGEIYRGIYPALSEMPLALALVRFVLAILALAPATVLMGATLPTLTRFLSHGQDGHRQGVPAAVRGEHDGRDRRDVRRGLRADRTVRATGRAARRRHVLGDRRRRCAAAGPTGRGPVADVDRGAPVPAVAARGRARRRIGGRIAAAEPGEPPRAGQLALSLPSSGLTSLGYQVVWNRLLAAGTGNSTYVFTIILDAVPDRHCARARSSAPSGPGSGRSSA